LQLPQSKLPNRAPNSVVVHRSGIASTMDLDIDDLLSEENRVPVKPAGSLRELEYILALNDDEELPEDVEVPYWLCVHLQQHSIAVPVMPKHYGLQMQGRLKAAAWSINLREQNFYFYECALKLSRLAKATGTGGGNVGTQTFRAVLRKGMAARYAEIMRESLNSRGSDISEFCDGAMCACMHSHARVWVLVRFDLRGTDGLPFGALTLPTRLAPDL
jgi:hypothetical protein